jgi:hypothetical protein
MRPADLGSFSRMTQILKSFKLPTPRICVRIAQAVETESYLFLGKRIIVPSLATHIKLVTIVLIAFCLFSLLPSHLPLPSPFTAQWLTPLFMTPLSPLFRRPTPMTRGTTPRQKSTVMAASSSPSRGAIRMAKWEIPELTDLFKKTIMTEDDRRAYHDRGWLTGNLVSFIPEVDVPTIGASEGSPFLLI